MNEPLLQQLKTLLATFSEQECMRFDHDFDALKQAYLRLTDAKLLNAIVQHADDKLSRLRRQLCHIIHITLNLVYDVHKNHKRTKSKSWNF